MSAIVYALCALTALTCSVLLLRAWAQSRVALLFWSGLCFAVLTINNCLLIIDRIFLPVEVDLTTLRLGVALFALLLLLYGLIWEESD